MLANNPSHDCSQGQLDDFESLPSIAKRHCHESNVMLRSAFSHQKFLQPVNTARLSRTLNIGNSTIARKVLNKANKSGTTSVDEMFLVFFFLFLFSFGRSRVATTSQRSKFLRYERITALQVIPKWRSYYTRQSLHSTMQSLFLFHFLGYVRQSCLTGVPECLLRAGRGLGDDVNTENE